MITTIILITYGVLLFFYGRYLERASGNAEIDHLIEHRNVLSKEIERLTLSLPPKRKRGRPRKNPIK